MKTDPSQQLLAVLPRETEGAHVRHTETAHDGREHVRVPLVKIPLITAPSTQSTC